MLKEYEKREDVMEAKVTGKQQEKLEMQAKVSTCTVDSESAIPLYCVKPQLYKIASI